jgi:hypothetical protein
MHTFDFKKIRDIFVDLSKPIFSFDKLFIMFSNPQLKFLLPLLLICTATLQSINAGHGTVHDGTKKEAVVS